jgi:mRNA interferase MazF
MACKPLYRGEIVLVPFPFTDLTGTKVRPAVIVSPDPQEADILLAFISSVLPAGPLDATDYLLESSHPDFATTGLRTSSVFKMKKLAAIERTRLGRRIGKVSQAIQAQLDARLRTAVGLPQS